MEQVKIQTDYSCGVDLHDKNLVLCIMDRSGNIQVRKKLQNNFEVFKKSLEAYKGKISVGVESTHNYYWLYDGCRKAGIPFYLGHAYYLRAIRGKKKKDDKIDSKTLTDLMRTNFFPVGYPYPEEKRAYRDLLRRRNKFVRLRAGLYNHIHLIYSQQGIIDLESSSLKSQRGRKAVLARLKNEELKMVLKTDMELIDRLDTVIKEIENRLKESLNGIDKQLYKILLSYPGIGETIALTILYEIDRIERFPSVQNFSSYSRVVKTQRESSGKRTDNKNQKIGNPYLKWAFSEAATHSVRASSEIKNHFENLTKRNGKKKARAILRHRIAIAVYYSLKRKELFSLEKFLQSQKKQEIFV